MILIFGVFILVFSSVVLLIVFVLVFLKAFDFFAVSSRPRLPALCFCFFPWAWGKTQGK